MLFTPEAWQVLSVIAGCFALLVFSRYPADVILIAGVGLLLLLNILTPQEAFHGLANEGMVTVGTLFIVVQALVQTGVVSWISNTLLGQPKRGIAGAQLRLMLPVAGLSTVLNNTPVVAMMVPAVKDWARRYNLSVSQLMIPLSYAAIIGGTCTLVGTSTNLIINEMLRESVEGAGLKMFDLAWVGLPCVLVVLLFTVMFSRWLLPHRGEVIDRLGDAREYVVEMEVEQFSPLAGLSIEEAGLRQLPGMFLVEIDRDGRLITAVSPKEIICASDHLIFAGDVRSVVDLKNIRGLKVAEKQVFKLSDQATSRCLVEAVISSSFPFLGQSIRDSGFRKHYGAVIIAVLRGDEQLKGRIGDIVLRPGDTLLLETHDAFFEQQRYSKDFLVAGRIENSKPVRHEKRNIAAMILLAMILLVTAGVLSMLKGAMLAAGAMIATRCINTSEARKCVDWQILLVIAASIGLGGALDKTGAATVIAEGLVGLSAGSNMATLATLFIVTTLFSAVISNLAAAVLLFPVALAASQQLNADMMPFAVTLMVAASTCFATPIGYQTNLMVYGPGNYRFVDFLKIGLPLTVLVGFVTVLVVPMVWSF